jgi:hypothetical protein
MIKLSPHLSDSENLTIALEHIEDLVYKLGLSLDALYFYAEGNEDRGYKARDALHNFNLSRANKEAV